MYHLLIDFKFSTQLNVRQTFNENTTWKLGENFGESLEEDTHIENKTRRTIEYTFTGKIYSGESIYSHPIIRNEYACFNASIGLFFPNIPDDKFIEIEINTDFPLFVSGQGLIENHYSYQTRLETLKSQLFVFTKQNYMTNSIIVTYYYDSYFWITPKYISETCDKFLNRCRQFFNIKEDIKFLINYIDEKDDVEEGFGGNGNFASFSFSIVSKEFPSSREKYQIMLVLLHETYHHFNKSTTYDKMWFGEGFTEFFCRYLSISKHRMKIECQKFAQELKNNPYYGNSVLIINKDAFWKNKSIQRLPYILGFVIAQQLYSINKKKFLQQYIKLINDMRQGFKPTNEEIAAYFDDIDDIRKYLAGEPIPIISK